MLIATAALAATAVPAQAAPDPRRAQLSSQGEFSLAPAREAAKVGARALPGMTSGCAGKTDHPYRSAGFVSVHASVNANANAKWICGGAGTHKYRGETYHRAYVNGQAQVAYTHADSGSLSC